MPQLNFSESDQQKYLNLEKEIDSFYIALNKQIVNDTKIAFETAEDEFWDKNPNFDKKIDQERPMKYVVERGSSRPPVFNDIRESIYTVRKVVNIKPESKRHDKETLPFFHPIKHALIKDVMKLNIMSESPLSDNIKKKLKK